MPTWNCRGRQSMASKASKVSVKKLILSGLKSSSCCFSPLWLMWWLKSPMPSNKLKVTNTPTATNATSLTIDSKAMANTIPRWCSLVSIWRVPNKMAKAAINIAMTRAVLLDPKSELPLPDTIIVKLCATALSCNAI